MKRYDADFYFRNTLLKQRKLSVKIIFINVAKALNFISLITELNQFINKRTYSTDISDFSSQFKKKKKKKINKINLFILDIAAHLKKEDFAD